MDTVSILHSDQPGALDRSNVSTVRPNVSNTGTVCLGADRMTLGASSAASCIAERKDVIVPVEHCSTAQFITDIQETIHTGIPKQVAYGLQRATEVLTSNRF